MRTSARLLSSVVGSLPALLLLGSSAYALQATGNREAAADDWNPTKPLTGHPIQCENGRIKTFICDNVELLSYLPKQLFGESSGYDVWGWHDSTTGREFVLIGGAATAFVEVT